MLEVAQQSSTKLTIPSARTIRRHLDITIQNNQKGILQRLPEGCRLSIALDCWTSPFQQAFMAITGVLSVTTDNATNNNTLMQSVQDHLQSQHSSDLSIFRVPCIAHVIQLSLNELLGKLKAVPSNKEIELEWSEEKTHSFQNKRNTSGSIQITYTLKKVYLLPLDPYNG